MKRLTVTLTRKTVMTVHREILDRKKVVYLLTATRAIRYKGGRSRVVYIGTTGRGIHRIAGSTAKRAADVMDGRGFKEVSVYVVYCSSRSGVPSWQRLEDALIAAFRSEYEQLPKCNKQGKKKKWNEDLDRMFKRKAIEKILWQFDPSR